MLNKNGCEELTGRWVEGETKAEGVYEGKERVLESHS